MFSAIRAAIGRSRRWRRVPKWRRRLYGIVAIAVVAVAPFALNQAYRAVLRFDPEWRFVEEVLLRPVSGGTDPLVIRWAASPRIALVEASAEDAAFVRALVATLDEVLEGSGLSPRLVEGGKSNFQVYFATRAKFDRLAVNLGADPLASGTGFYLIWPSERLDIVAAVAVVGTDASAAERQAVIVHQLAHALGLRGDSAVFPESAMFTEGDRGSTATALSPIDRKLLRLLYRHLGSADAWSDLRAAYRRYWDAS